MSPLVDYNCGVLGVTIVCHDVTEPRRVQAELGSAHRQMETAYEEPQDRTLRSSPGCAPGWSSSRPICRCGSHHQAHELRGLRPEETVGQHFRALGIGLPSERLGPMSRRALSGHAGMQELVLSAVDRRGRHIGVRVRGTPLTDHDRRPRARSS